MKLKKGDKVKIIKGKDRGREAVIEKIYSKQSKVLIPNINIYKKHIKKSDKFPQGGVIELPRAMDVSNVALICPICKKTTRVGYKSAQGKKYRICKKCDSQL